MNASHLRLSRSKHHSPSSSSSSSFSHPPHHTLTLRPLLLGSLVPRQTKPIWVFRLHLHLHTQFTVSLVFINFDTGSLFVYLPIECECKMGAKKSIRGAECVPPLLSKTLLKPWNGLSYQSLLALAGTQKFNGTSEVKSQPPSHRAGPESKARQTVESIHPL